MGLGHIHIYIYYIPYTRPFISDRREKDYLVFYQ